VTAPNQLIAAFMASMLAALICLSPEQVDGGGGGGGMAAVWSSPRVRTGAGHQLHGNHVARPLPWGSSSWGGYPPQDTVPPLATVQEPMPQVQRSYTVLPVLDVPSGHLVQTPLTRYSPSTHVVATSAAGKP
jgi:hypothetical protein